MRRPWVPMIQSRGEEAGWKLSRRVTVTDKEGSSVEEMGEKRVSSKALVGGEGGGRGMLVVFSIFLALLFLWG